MTDPNTPTQPTNNPQDLIDQALGSTPTPAVTPDPTPTLPVPEALTTPAPIKEETPMSPDSALPPAETVPTELTAKSEVVPVMSEPPVDTKPMGEDMPLAFMGSTPADTTTSQPVSNLTVEPVAPASIPPILTNNSNTNDNNVKPKKKGFKVVGLMIGLLSMLGAVGYSSYSYYISNYGENATIAVIADKTEYTCGGCEDGNQVKWKNGQCVQINKPCGGGEEGNPTNTGNQSECTGCREGYEVEWNGSACIKRRLCNVEENTNEASCAADGGSWCSSVDAKGRSYGFCGKTSSTKNCNDLAAEQGYLIIEGIVKCVKGDDGKYHADRNYSGYQGMTLANWNQVETQCTKQLMGTGAFLCKMGVKGYDGGQCTDLNGVPFTGALGCFCGTVQVDTGTGHTSYTSSCGCDKPEDTPNPSPSPSTPTVNPTLMCSSLTRTPTTTPAVGDKVTFTCVGASTPAGAVSLTYKFRYSLNSGAYVSMTNKTATTSELTVASCGSYKVQCQACGTINGVLTCDPNWTAATQ